MLLLPPRVICIGINTEQSKTNKPFVSTEKLIEKLCVFANKRERMEQLETEKETKTWFRIVI